MKRALIVAAIAAALQTAGLSQAQEVEPTPIESDAMLAEGITERQTNVAAALVRAFGYRCDSISGMVPFVFSTGFHVYCNYHRYSYEIEDKGGRWTVTVD